jgi:hypothetical protein
MINARRARVFFIQEYGMAIVAGKVEPPKDLQPAIDALSETGRNYLKALAAGENIHPWMIAKAADYERGELDG